MTKLNLLAGSKKPLKAFELLARLNNLTLVGVDYEGRLDWIGTYKQWQQVTKDELNAKWK